MAHLTDQQANEVYDILVRYGARESQRFRFLECAAKVDEHNKEYLFGGEFESGKLHVSSRSVSASCSMKHETHRRLLRLAELCVVLQSFKPLT